MSNHKTAFVDTINEYRQIFNADQVRCILTIYDLATEKETQRYLKFCDWMKQLNTQENG